MKIKLTLAAVCAVAALVMFAAARRMDEPLPKELYADRVEAGRTEEFGHSPVPYPTAEDRAAAEEEILVRTLAAFVYGTARDRPYVRQISLAAAVLNRMRHPAFPDTAAGVILQMQEQNGALLFDGAPFSDAVTAQLRDRSGEDAKERAKMFRCYCAARLACMGMDPTGGSTDPDSVAQE